DLVTKEIDEPYRMLTSRAEYRLLLRQDNADLRLTEKGYRVGLVTAERYRKFEKKKKLVEEEKARLEKTVLPVTEEGKKIMGELKTADIPRQGIKLAGLLRRPEINYEKLRLLPVEHPHLPGEVCEQVEIQIKYAGYIKKQQAQVERSKKLEEKRIPGEINYALVKGLSVEAREKLEKIKPAYIGQAARIAGVTPADISVLLIHMEQLRRRKKK
ncbi:MAG: tRNA uridine 5-carboxymethylaminomethyl modification enzyme MnmG, partial [Pelotomaculum thermopropionicum]